MSFFSRDTRFSIFFLVSFALPAWAGCKAGTYCTWSACPNYSDCTACPGGQYYSTYRSVSSSCTECDEGYFCPIGSSSMTSCPAGYYCPSESASYTACSPGQYCEAGSSSETPCPSGTYSASTASSCSECPSDQPYSCTGADMCDENPCDRYFEIYEGDCTTDDEGTCIYSPNYPSNYVSSSSCSINVNKDTVLDVEAFATETDYDYLTVNDVDYSGGSGPQDIEVFAGDFIYFDSDSSVSYSGFAICASITGDNDDDEYDDDFGESEFPIYMIFVAAIPFACMAGLCSLKSYIRKYTEITHSIQRVVPEGPSTALRQATQVQQNASVSPIQQETVQPSTSVASNTTAADSRTFVVSVISPSQQEEEGTPIVAYVVE